MNTFDVIIVGGGPAGLAAAAALRQRGLEKIVVLERRREAGGIPRHCPHTGFGLSEWRLLSGPAYAERLFRAVADFVQPLTTVRRLHPNGELDIIGPEGPQRIVGRAVLLATGARETPRGARFVSGDRPWGVVTTGAIQALVSRSVNPFRHPVIVGSELVAFSAILTLRRVGVTPLAMIEEAPRITTYRPAGTIARRLLGVAVMTRTKLVRIVGRDVVTGIEVERDGRREALECDSVIFTGGFRPETAIVLGSHLAIDPGTRGPVVDQHWRCSDPTYFAAGNVLRGIETADTAAGEGRQAAASIADALGAPGVPPTRVAIVRSPHLAYVYPQVVAVPGQRLTALQFRARMAHPVVGTIRVLIDGKEAWTDAGTFLPQRRIQLPWGIVPTARLRSLEILVEESLQ